MLQKTGERQVGANLDEIRDDHKERYLWARAQLRETDAVLDAGCGVGYGSVLLSEKVRNVRAIDVSEDAIAYARRYWRRTNISHEVQDLHFLDLPDATKFDAVVAFEIVEHLVEPRLFLQRVRRHLHASGRLILSVPNEKQIPHTVDLNPFHMRHYTVEEVTELLSESGYQVETILGQDAKDLNQGASGKFLVVEATPVAVEESNERLALLCQSAVSTGAALIVVRAAALAKAKRDIQALKLRLEEATKRQSVEAQDARRNDYFAVVDTIGQRIQAIEGALISDLRQRSNFVEAAERSARESLAAAQYQILRLEDEKRALSGDVKRVEERRAEQSVELSRLQTELSTLSRTLETARADTVRISFLQDSLADHKFQLDSARDGHSRQAAVLESERAAAVRLEKRLLGELDQLRLKLQAAEEEAKDGSRLREALLRDQEVQTLRIGQLEQILDKAEEDAKEGDRLREALLRDQEVQTLRIGELERILDKAEEDAKEGDRLREALALDHEVQMLRCAELEQVINAVEGAKALLAEQHRVAVAELDARTQEFAATQARLAEFEAGSAVRDAVLAEQNTMLESERTTAQQLGEKIESLSQQITMQEKQLGGNKKQVHEMQIALKAAQAEIEAKKREVSTSNGKIENASIRLLAVAAENDVLRKANESLALEVERARANRRMVSAAADAVTKEPPSLGYLWRKLKHHHFYGPFVGRAIRNSLGLKRSRKIFTR